LSKFIRQSTPIYNSETGFLWTLKAAQNGLTEAQLALAKCTKRDKYPVNAQLTAQWEQAAEKDAPKMHQKLLWHAG